MDKAMDHITCPYCFSTFSHDEVHFRMETVLTPDEFDVPANEEDRKYELKDIDNDITLSDEERKRRHHAFVQRSAFAEGDDSAYTKFWDARGGTTEDDPVTVGTGMNQHEIQAYQMPVFNPMDARDRQNFAAQPLLRRTDGFVRGAVDCFGNETSRRVCPKCHNPLPGAYGTYPVKFISVIGVTGAGKTVFLSQLCRYVEDQFAGYDISITPTSAYAHKYQKENAVDMGRPLPAGTAPGALLQPLCFDVSYNIDTAQGQESRKQTLVFYDIAGENCMQGEGGTIGAGLNRFGPFIEHSDGLILLVAPEQIANDTQSAVPTEVLTVIHALFGMAVRGTEALETMPLAVCISKGDTIDQMVLGEPMHDMVEEMDGLGRLVPKFNAQDYNYIQGNVSRFVETNARTLATAMRSNYHCSNYFLFSAIGTDVVAQENPTTGQTFYAPAAPVSPKRLAEPLLWILTQFRYLDSTGFVNEPNDWQCPKCGRRLHLPRKGDQRSFFCPDCLVNKDGQWQCPSCGKLHDDAEVWCENKESGRKCNCDRYGNRKKRFGLF